MTSIKNLDTNLLGINQMTFASTGSVGYGIKYFKNLDGVNSLYLIFNDVDAYFECIDEKKYLIFTLTDKNREALENYKELWSEGKEEIETIKEYNKTIKPIRYEKDFMKIRFESDYDLLLSKILNIPVCLINAKSAFQKNDKYYPQVHLKDFF